MAKGVHGEREGGDDQSEEDMIGFRSEDVKGMLAQLTERNIIQIGIKPHCPRCGLAQWYYVDDVGQHRQLVRDAGFSFPFIQNLLGTIGLMNLPALLTHCMERHL